MTYTRVMYDMPPPKVGENTGYWQLPRDCKSAGALAAACIVNKTFPDVYNFLEEKFWEIVRNEELAMARDPIKPTPKWARFILRIFGLSFLYEYEDLTAKERAHRIFPMFEEISDEEWLRRAAPIHYPYHTPESQRAYDREMAWRHARREREWEERFAAYKKEQREIKRKQRAETRAQEEDDGFFDCESFASDSSFHSDSSVGSTSAESVLDKLCVTLRNMYKNGVKPSDPEFQAVLKRAEDVDHLIMLEDESDTSSISTTDEVRRMRALPEPNWNIKLDEKMNLTILDFDNDPFLTPADEENLDNVQGCFNTRDIRIAEEIICRFPTLLRQYGKTQDEIKQGKEEHKRLMILYNRLKVRLDASIHGILPDGQTVGDEDSDDDSQDDESEDEKSKNDKSSGDEDDSDDPDNQPEWLRTVSKKPRLIIETPDMDVNPKHVGIHSMTDEEEEDYFTRLHETQRELFETEEARKERIAQEIQKKGNVIQWLRTRDREDFPTLARIPTSNEAASPFASTEEAFAHRQERSMEQEPDPRLFDGQTLKCFAAGPHHTRDDESLEWSSNSSAEKKKSLVVRGVEKGIKKIKSLRESLRRKMLSDDSSDYIVYSGHDSDSVTC